MSKAYLILPAVVCACSSVWGNSGVQLPLSQFQAGTEETTGSVVVNGNFEQPGTPGTDPTGWTAYTNGFDTPGMTTGAPTPGALPNNPAVLGNLSAQANFRDVTFIDEYRQTIQLQPNTDYVLSSYVWSFGLGSPGDTAVINLRDTVDTNRVMGIVLGSTAADGGDGGNGYFTYKPFNSGFFTNSTVQLEIQTDPDEGIGGARPTLMAQFDNVAITPLANFAVHKWNGPSGGNWGDNSNWINNAPNGETTVASFLARPAATTVVVDADKTTAVLTLNSAAGYTLNGPGQIRLQHDETHQSVYINAVTGSHTINAPVVVVQPSDNPFFPNRTLKVNVAGASDTLTVTSSITRNANQLFNLEKNGAGRLLLNQIETNNLQINAGRVSFADGAATSVTRNFGIAAGASLDIGTGAFVMDRDAGNTLAELALNSALAEGRITSRALDSRHVVGIKPITTAGTFAGVAVDDTAFGLRYTLRGDSDLNLTVNFDDLLILAQNYGQEGRRYWEGDTDYNFIVNFDDLLALAQNYGGSLPSVAALSSLGSEFAHDWALALSLVPEPSTAFVLGAGSLAMRRRRS